MLTKVYTYFKGLNTSWQSIIFVGTVSILFFVIVSQSLSIIQMRYHINKLEDSVMESDNENKLLVEKLEKTTTERYVEEIAREKLGMVRSNEVPVQVNVVKNEKATEENHILDSKDKAGIYLEEWYTQLGKWFKKEKN
ncbi:FtsB family cell division protein [Bacillus thuringiensis]|uniref:FtsB family cell division protein n=1 Tax=Bacillus thuringiensis TaxID=1428 RepID=UPI0021D67F36|nr:septum formation initiator family protein [Bacillus thuringiensis]MCU7667038.1 septum formation initiator family protein [Bacillus thuringiensis]